MQRVAFVMKVKPGMEEEYKRRHRPENIWPSILAACKRAGIHNYSIYMYGQTLFAYMEVEKDFETAMAALSADPDNAPWQEYMAPLMDVKASFEEGEAVVTLEEVFHLD
jgi:L-rhamnose mutarotase